MEQREVIIIGGGPAGIATALYLQRYAADVSNGSLILEKSRHPRPKPCGGGITHFADLILDDLEIAPTCESFPIHAVEFKLPRETMLFQYANLMRIVQRPAFDAALVKSAVSRGIELRQDQNVHAIRREAGGIVVETDSQTFRARVVVGADGAKSVVRKHFLREKPSRVSRLLEVFVPLASASPRVQSNTALFDFGHDNEGLQGYLWEFPGCFGGTPSLNVGIFDSRIRDGAHANLKDLIEHKLQALGVSGKSLKMVAHPERWFMPHGRYSAPNLLLVGDAAGIEPWLGEGISYALAYGRVAGRTIADAFAGGDFNFSDYTQNILNDRLGRLLNRNRRIADYFYSSLGRLTAQPFGKMLELYFNMKYHRRLRAKTAS